MRASGVPVIYFPNGATTLLERVARVGADVYGIDWRLPHRRGAGPRCSTAEPPERRCKATWTRLCCWARPTGSSGWRRDIIARGGRRGHVFNLGHGIYPETPIESVETLVRAVRGT